MSGGGKNHKDGVFHYDKINDAQFGKFSKLVYKKTGIFLKPQKKDLLNARLGKRLRALRLNSFEKYYDYVIHDKTGEELVQLINCVSTNFTSFFREKSHFDFLSTQVIPDFIKEGRFKQGGIVLWSAACSSGEEPYTLSMILEDYFADKQGGNYRIIATDISTRVLSIAEKGVYPLERVEKTPPKFLRKYFKKGVGKAEGYVKIREEIYRRVSFRRFNLMDEFPWVGSLDIIFCRNVMIYFDRETQQALVDKFYRALTPGGYLFIGHSESLTSVRHEFNQVASTTYKK